MISGRCSSEIKTSPFREAKDDLWRLLEDCFVLQKGRPPRRSRRKPLSHPVSVACLTVSD